MATLWLIYVILGHSSVASPYQRLLLPIDYKLNLMGPATI